ncbi:DNA-directed RNA polymerase subunit beta' [candidate division LCP-89 bacterium B3_LCP]|uniref:DNA-directed RNA polymerase subunit beta' n=1 Tax=candidate division LCP-89 bacterium B3_LCP TaxID=2012998 RepID=A0A532UZP5_UNCL8|nr:MAG: DNA-directed RNA polymerase subunit beta' [candidate division LCP-89 bacterium B3_LCP]
MLNLRPNEQEHQNFTRISINLAGSNTILEKSRGEVTKPETINYRSYKPEKEGLFCEKIFGPVKDWECHCGKYRGIRYRDITCDRCGVEITRKDVRRKRMGHITLAVPIVHIWYFRSLPSKIGYILGMTVRDLESIIYYEKYVVISPGNSGLKYKDLINETEYQRLITESGQDSEKLPNDDKRKFIAKMGGEAVNDLLVGVDIEVLSAELRAQVRTETSIQRKNDAIKKLRIIEAFKVHDDGSFNRPEWMVMSVVPVVPPDLRPLVPLEGGRFATSDLNDLYRRVIIRNNRLKRLMEIQAPEVILRNEKRMLQEAVDSLFDNGRKSVAVRSDSNRPLKSLSDNLKGKQGRFRQNLLGKRVDYSGRSVIVVGPELKLNTCGLPKDMAVELFKPFIIRKLIEQEFAKTVKSAKRLVERKDDAVWGILEDIIHDHPVLLNRAPTLHRLGIQAFQPIMIEGKAIRLHPLVCAAFNADFDGDQMAVHIPLSYEAQIEAKLLMSSTQNLLHPASGRPIAIPTQDMVLGCYYLTKTRKEDLGSGRQFFGPEEVIVALDNKLISLHAQIKVRILGEMLETSAGRIIFNRILPNEVKVDTFFNELLTKKRLEQIAALCNKRVGMNQTAKFLDNLKNLGFSYATKGGLSVSLEDVEIPQEKNEMVDKAFVEVEKVQSQYETGVITDGERYNKIIDIWTHTTSDVADVMVQQLKESNQGFNPVYMMIDSGARGSKEQIRQLAGMRGLMAKPQKTMTGQKGEIIESPITANFKEGLSVLEYFISTHGARKGLADTALKTADAGYLTRRLVDVSQDVIVREKDCGTLRGIIIEAVKEGEEIASQLAERILGRVLAEDVFDPFSGEKLLDIGKMIDEEDADLLVSRAVDKVRIRSVLTCETQNGVCSHCYGMNLTNVRMVDSGEAVGVMAAQSIGEPGTQLTLRTFHIGGTASRIAEKSQVISKHDGKIEYENVYAIRHKDTDNLIALRRNGIVKVLDVDNRTIAKYDVPHGAEILVNNGTEVKSGQEIMRWDPYAASIFTSADGVVHFVDIKADQSYREEVDEATGKKQKVIIEVRNKKLNPHIHLDDEDGNKLENINIPVGANLLINDGDKVEAGDALAKIPREIAKTKDITGGLPRVAELFEVRRPKEPAIVSEIDGLVKFGSLKRGVREIVIKSHDGKMEKKYLIPFGKHIIVNDGEHIDAGDRISEGSIAPQDILNILGPSKVQEHLVNEIQAVYRLQGVKINDKHIEVIVRQMLQKVRVEEPGDTSYLEGDQVDASRFIPENKNILSMVIVEKVGDSQYQIGQMVNKTEFKRGNRKLQAAELQPAAAKPAKPAIYQPLLLGITQAALSTESFISAASFQETTRVLTEAAVERKVDFLKGLKENVIMGHLIPAGTGLSTYDNIEVEAPEEEELPDLDEVKIKTQPYRSISAPSLLFGDFGDASIEALTTEQQTDSEEGGGDEEELSDDDQTPAETDKSSDKENSKTQNDEKIIDNIDEKK